MDNPHVMCIFTYKKQEKQYKIKFFTIDQDDKDRVYQHTWYNGSYGYLNNKNLGMTLHRFIMGCTNNDETLIDHIDRNKQNTQKSNLRYSTYQQNARNQSKQKNTTSKYFGVTSVQEKWRAIYYLGNGRYKSLGHYNDEIQAAKVYDAQVVRNNPQEKRLNFPDEINIDLFPNNYIQKNEDMKYVKQNKKSCKKPFEVRVPPEHTHLGFHETADRAKKIRDEYMYFYNETRLLGNIKLEDNNEKTIFYYENSPALKINTKNQVKYCKVSLQDYHLLCTHKIYLSSGGYAQFRDENGIRRLLHRYIMNQFDQFSYKEVVDHINGNCLDNRRKNLRIVSQVQNSHNSKKRLNTTSQYRGVSKKYNKWITDIVLNKIRYKCGNYNNEDDAGRAVNLKAIEIYGDVACLNKVDINGYKLINDKLFKC